MKEQELIEAPETLQRNCDYFTLSFKDQKLTSFSLKEKKVESERRSHGVTSRRSTSSI